eukprot:m.74168 g.74168  ORF g.74168 m.74168 type:complete len:161 (-) comp14411_c0_seq2:115-597(-)
MHAAHPPPWNAFRVERSRAHVELTWWFSLQDNVVADIGAWLTPFVHAWLLITTHLLSTTRALSFIRVFLSEVVNPSKQALTACATKAYEQTLRKYHNFLVRGIFSLAMKAVPTRENFFKALGGTKTDEAGVTAQINVYLAEMTEQLNAIDLFYAQNQLDS